MVGFSFAAGLMDRFQFYGFVGVGLWWLGFVGMGLPAWFCGGSVVALCSVWWVCGYSGCRWWLYVVCGGFASMVVVGGGSVQCVVVCGVGLRVWWLWVSMELSVRALFNCLTSSLSSGRTSKSQTLKISSNGFKKICGTRLSK